MNWLFWVSFVLVCSIYSILGQTANPSTAPSNDPTYTTHPSFPTKTKQITIKKSVTTTPKPESSPNKKSTYLDGDKFKKGTCNCNWNNSSTVQFACCDIDEPSYLEFDVLRKQIQYDTLQDLYLFKSDVYSFLFDTDHPNFTVKTIYNSNFVTGYFRVSEHEDVHIHHHTENYYLSNCEISPELLGRTLKHFPDLKTLHLEHVRLLPYPPTAVIPLNSPATVLNVVDEVYGKGNQIESLSLVDCKIYTLQMKKYYDQEHFVTLKNFTELKILSLASNQIKNIDKIIDFLPTDSKIFHLDLSNNQIVSLPDKWNLPSGIKHIDLRRNALFGITVDSLKLSQAIFFAQSQIEEFLINIYETVFMFGKDLQVSQTDIKFAIETLDPKHPATTVKPSK